MALKLIGAVESTSVYYSSIPDKFYCLSAQSVAIVEAFEAGASLSDVEVALRHSGMEDPSAEAKLHWELIESTRPKDTQQNIPTQDTKALVDHSPPIFDEVESLIVDCGQTLVNISMDVDVSALITPLIKRYYHVVPESNAPMFGHIQLAAQPDGSILKRVTNNSQVNTSQSCGPDELFVHVAHDLAELACDYCNAITFLHAATLCRGSDVWMLTNPSGSGKTTLAWQLTQNGYDLIHDDVLPVTRDGQISQMLTPSTIKEGSWNILTNLDLHTDAFARIGTTARYHPIARTKLPSLFAQRNLVFINRDPDQPTQMTPLTKLETFQRLVSDQCVLRDRSIGTLRQFFTWVSECDGYTLTYSDGSDVANILQSVTERCDA
jgi:hypothetical protein